MEPEHHPFEKKKHIFQTFILRFHVKNCRGCIISYNFHFRVRVTRPQQHAEGITTRSLTPQLAFFRNPGTPEDLDREKTESSQRLFACHRNARWKLGGWTWTRHAPCPMMRMEHGRILYIYTYMNGLTFMVNVCLVNILYPKDQLYGIFTYTYTNLPYKSTIHVCKYTLNRWYGMKKKVVLVQLNIGFPKKKKKHHNVSIQRSLKPLSQLSNSFLLLFEL